MIQSNGVGGKRAPYETTHVCIPYELKAEVEALVDEYRAKFVDQAGINRETFNSQAAINREQFNSQAVINRENLDNQAAIDRENLDNQAAIDRENFDNQASIDRENLNSQAAIDRDSFISESVLERNNFNRLSEQKRDEFDDQAVANEQMGLSTLLSEYLENLDAAIARLEEALLLKDNASFEINHKIREALKLLRTLLTQGS